jgi:hypothetical protein
VAHDTLVSSPARAVDRESIRRRSNGDAYKTSAESGTASVSVRRNPDGTTLLETSLYLDVQNNAIADYRFGEHSFAARVLRVFPWQRAFRNVSLAKFRVILRFDYRHPLLHSWR